MSVAFWAVTSADAQNTATSLLGLHSDSLDLQAIQPFALRPFIVPGSVQVFLNGTRRDSTSFKIDYRLGYLWMDVADSSQSAAVQYRTWDLGLRDRYQWQFATSGPPDSIASTELAEPSDQFRLLPRGSITRGVLAGNGQDATIESGLRLQVAGQVAENVDVRAVLTDESTPILPEGTTQRLSEIDRVYVEINAHETQAQLGDIDVRYEDAELARLARKVQGVGVTTSGRGITVQSAVGTARGVYTRSSIPLTDGVQGPYKLLGQNGERFIFVVPGSETIYLDGRQVARGETEDYVIDYATGEITFTARRLIRDHHRIRAEYQYRTTEFTRTIMANDIRGSFGRVGDQARFTFGAAMLREADGRTFGEEFGLSDDDLARLTAAGDSAVYISSATPVPYDPDAPFVQYTVRDTVFEGASLQYYAPATGANGGPVYRVQFTHVGTGNGDYVRRGAATNGVLFVWRGSRRGDYVPRRTIPKPKSQRIVDLRGALAVVEGVEFFGEWASSGLDGNRYSALHEDDDQGTAYVAGVRVRPRRLGPRRLGAMSFEARRRSIGTRYSPLDRIRHVEFGRRWHLGGLAGRSTVGDETNEAKFMWELSENSTARAEVGRIALPDGFAGNRTEVRMQFAEGRWPHVAYRREAMRTRDPVLGERGSWTRLSGQVSRPMGHFVPLIALKRSNRRQTLTEPGAQGLKSKAYNEIRPGVSWQKDQLEFDGGVRVRWDLDADGGIKGRWVTLDTGYDIRPRSALSASGRVGWRSRTTLNSRAEESVVLQWSGRWQPWQRLFRLDWHYDAQSERTPVMQEIYIRTGAEIGEYVWNDDNGDGIRQVAEFVPESTQDEGVYVRTLLPSDTLQSVIGMQSRLVLTMDFARRWREAERPWLRRFANISLRTIVRIQEKSSTPHISDIYLFRLSQFRHEDYSIRGLLSARHELSLFRNQSDYGISTSLLTVRTHNALAAGTDSRAVDTWGLEGFMTPIKQVRLRVKVEQEHQQATSQSFISRAYDIRSYRLEPTAIIAIDEAWRMTIGAALAQKAAISSDAVVWRVPLTVEYSVAGRASIRMGAEGTSVAVDGALPAGLAYYELTDGRGVGRSRLWNLSAWYQLTRALRANLYYNGRAPDALPVIHTVRLQMTATF